MVRAINAGGEAQSIADFAVIEPTPERMVEVVKTVVFENANQTNGNNAQAVGFIFIFIFISIQT